MEIHGRICTTFLYLYLLFGTIYNIYDGDYYYVRTGLFFLYHYFYIVTPNNLKTPSMKSSRINA